MVFEIIKQNGSYDYILELPYATIRHCLRNIIRDEEKNKKEVVIEFRLYENSDLFYPANVKLY
jgi:hypothetical protein